jgi:hypothetical protein
MIMRVGITERFAIEWEVFERIEGWILGSFYLWINGIIVGNPSDHSVDLKGCANWLKDLMENSTNRFEPGLFDMSREQTYLRLAPPVLVHENREGFAKEIYKDTFSRFHISHIGMSSFDRVTLLLIKNELGQERCIWKADEKEVKDAFLESGEIESVAAQFVKAFNLQRE